MVYPEISNYAYAVIAKINALIPKNDTVAKFYPGSGNFTVGGDLNSFYPVSFYDPGYDNNVATELAIGRSNVHTDADWSLLYM